MKNKETNLSFRAVQTALFVEDFKTNVRDKNEMRNRLLNTHLLEPTNIHIEAWAPGDENLVISYERGASLFGDILIASTPKGLCYLGFNFSSRVSALDDLKKRFPKNMIIEKASPLHEAAIKMMNDPGLELPLQLHLKGTKFQLEIWKKLAEIPMGGFTTYGQIGGSNKSARATGTAVGRNPISYLLPCHRVIHTDGNVTGYFWGTEIKEKILAWETQKATL